MIDEKSKVIAVDFDGTIVEHNFPEIGREMLFAFDTLKALQKKGHRIILWTFRTGKFLDEAVAYCHRNGMDFYAVNKSFPEEELSGDNPRKIQADLFIDDRNLGGFPGWSKVWQILHPDSGEFIHKLVNQKAHENYSNERSILFKLKRVFKMK
jgi:hypothetical protein